MSLQRACPTSANSFEERVSDVVNRLAWEFERISTVPVSCSSPQVQLLKRELNSLVHSNLQKNQQLSALATNARSFRKPQSKRICCSSLSRTHSPTGLVSLPGVFSPRARTGTSERKGLLNSLAKGTELMQSKLRQEMKVSNELRTMKNKLLAHIGTKRKQVNLKAEINGKFEKNEQKASLLDTRAKYDLSSSIYRTTEEKKRIGKVKQTREERLGHARDYAHALKRGTDLKSRELATCIVNDVDTAGSFDGLAVQFNSAISNYIQKKQEKSSFGDLAEVYSRKFSEVLRTINSSELLSDYQPFHIAPDSIIKAFSSMVSIEAGLQLHYAELVATSARQQKHLESLRSKLAHFRALNAKYEQLVGLKARASQYFPSEGLTSNELIAKLSSSIEGPPPTLQSDHFSVTVYYQLLQICWGVLNQVKVISGNISNTSDLITIYLSQLIAIADYTPSPQKQALKRAAKTQVSKNTTLDSINFNAYTQKLRHSKKDTISAVLKMFPDQENEAKHIYTEISSNSILKYFLPEKVLYNCILDAQSAGSVTHVKSNIRELIRDSHRYLREKYIDILETFSLFLVSLTTKIDTKATCSSPHKKPLQLLLLHNKSAEPPNRFKILPDTPSKFRTPDELKASERPLHSHQGLFTGQQLHAKQELLHELKAQAKSFEQLKKRSKLTPI